MIKSNERLRSRMGLRTAAQTTYSLKHATSIFWDGLPSVVYYFQTLKRLINERSIAYCSGSAGELKTALLFNPRTQAKMTKISSSEKVENQMKRTKRTVQNVGLGLATMAGCFLLPALSRAQTTTDGMIRLYVDPKTHIVYTEPGRGRRLLTEVSPSALSGSGQTLERRQEETERKVDQDRAKLAELGAKNQQLQLANDDLTHQMAQIKPAWQSYTDRWLNKFSLGTLVYLDYAMYTHTSYGPQFTTQVNPPGPQNNIYSSFDVTRTYLDFQFKPNDDFTVRVTPNIYRQVGNGSSTNTAPNTTVSSNVDGNLDFRLKYGYLQWNTPFRWNEALRKDLVKLGIQQQPLTDWEERLWGFRYVGLTPWNYLSLSSSYPGLAVQGPIYFGPSEKYYMDYAVGVYDNANFHHYQQANTKDAMGRITVYPFGATKDFDGLGLTGFYDYGYNNKAPSATSSSATSNNSLQRWAALVHYNSSLFNLAGEFDWGRNAFNSGNLFSGSGPNSGTQEANLANLIQNQTHSNLLGYDFLGSIPIPHTPFTAFGLFEQNWSNTNANVNPFDFQRFLVGVEYQYNKYLKFALDSQNLLYYHNQFDFTSADVAALDKNAPQNIQGGVKYPVPRDIHAIMFNVQFQY